MEFASEMVVKATLRDQAIAEVPTTLSPDGRGRPPHLRTWRDGWRHLRFLLLFSPRWLFVYPGLALLALGMVGMLWLLPGPRTIGGLGFDVNTLVFASAAIVCGFQASTLGFLARAYATKAGLLPASRTAERVLAVVSVEGGVLTGLALVSVGLAGAIVATGFWGSRSFGALDPLVSLRLVIPSATALILGGQMMLTAFFIGLLELRTMGRRTS